MSPRGVDVCTAVLGQTWTPALERTGVTYDPETDTLAEDVADEIIANIANGPTYVVGVRNQGIAARVWPDRRMLVQMIGAHQRPRSPHERHALLCDGSGSTC